MYLTSLNKSKRNNFLAFGPPLIEKDEIGEVVKTLRSGWLSTGPKVERFEKLFREYVGSKHACALNSCSAGLHLSLLVAGVNQGDEVITTPFTFAATANAIIHVGAKPVFIDIEIDTMNINPDLIERKITSRTKAIIPVHFAGRPCNMNKIMAIARKHKLVVIEDAAHAIGAEYHGKKIGSIGDLTCFSFYANKNITTGEGGMVTTNNDEWQRRIRMLSFHGINKGPWQRYSEDDLQHYTVDFPGYKYNMMDLQAAIGIHQLRKIEKFLKRREEIWSIYDEAFKNLPVNTPVHVKPNIRHARHLYTLILDIKKIKMSRDRLRKALHEENIGTGVHFVSIHLHPYYQKAFSYKRGNFPNAEYISDRTISLPLSPSLSDKDLQDVVSSVKKVLNN